MDRLELINNIDSGNIGKLYLVCGEEFLLIDEIIHKFKSIIDEDMADFNLRVIDGTETSLDEVKSSIETFPMFGDRRVTIVKEFELLTGKKKNFVETDEDILIKAMSDISDTSVVVFSMYGKVDKKRKFYKAINDNGVVCEINRFDDSALYEWVKSEFEKRDTLISKLDVGYFIEVMGYKDKSSIIRLADMEKEIEKLSSYASGDKVTKDAIDNLLRARVENDIFKFIDMIGTKNPKRAYKILEDMIDNGESVLGIFALLYRQFNNIIKVKLMKDQRKPKEIIMKELDMKSFVFNKVSKQAMYYNEENLYDIIKFLSDCDYKIKNGLIKDTLAAEIFISKYCSK